MAAADFVCVCVAASVVAAAAAAPTTPVTPPPPPPPHISTRLGSKQSPSSRDSATVESGEPLRATRSAEDRAVRRAYAAATDLGLVLQSERVACRRRRSRFPATDEGETPPPRPTWGEGVALVDKEGVGKPTLAEEILIDGRGATTTGVILEPAPLLLVLFV